MYAVGLELFEFELRRLNYSLHIFPRFIMKLLRVKSWELLSGAIHYGNPSRTHSRRYSYLSSFKLKITLMILLFILIVQSARIISQELCFRFVDRSPKYIVYNSHSGFSNQRIALENAIQLALQLDATLVVPCANIGEAQPWLEYDRLTETSFKLEALRFSRRLENNSTCLPFQDFLDFETLQTNFPALRLVGLLEFMHKFGLSEKISKTKSFAEAWMDIQVDCNTINIRDNIAKSYQLFDSSQNPEIDIEKGLSLTPMLFDIQLLKRSKKLHRLTSRIRNREAAVIFSPKITKKRVLVIKLGSLFGTNRLIVTTPAQKIVKKEIIDSLTIYKNDVISYFSDKIMVKLGGMGNYVVCFQVDSRVFMQD